MWHFDIHTHCAIITTIKLINISMASYSYNFYLCGDNTQNQLT